MRHSLPLHHLLRGLTLGLLLTLPGVPLAAHGQSTVVEVRIAATGDDAEERVGGGVNLTSRDLELTFDKGGHQVVGLRFPDLAIPAGAPIVDAWVQFQVDETPSEFTDLLFQATAVDDAPPFLDVDFDISSRPRTASSVGWIPPAWPTTGAAGPDQRSPGLAALIQEVVDRAGWAPGNALALVVTGTGERVAESFDGVPAGAPLLHVEYLGDPVNQPPTVSAGDDATLELPVTQLALAGVAGDDDLPGGGLALLWSHVGGDGPGAVGFDDPTAADAVATFTANPGSYVLRLEADDGELVSMDELTVIVLDPGESIQSTEVRIQSGPDDAEQKASGRVNLGSRDLELTFDDGDQTIGLRFPGLDVPRDAEITQAWVQFQVDEAPSDPTFLVIEGQAADHAAPFADVSGNIGNRPRTGAFVDWAPAAWPIRGEAGPDQRTPDLAAVIEEIVRRPGWAPGNALALIITGTGERVAESVEGSASGAPLLHVEYVAAPPANTAPQVDAGPDRLLILPNDQLALDATVDDDGLPGGGTSSAWSHVGGSGAGTVSFGDSTAVDTTATFTPDPGTYVLRLFADDGELDAFDELTVTVSPEGAGPVTLIGADFDTGPDGFAYSDDAFRGTSQPAYASGAHIGSGGLSGGALQVTLGGLDTTIVHGMSGAFSRSFTLDEPMQVTAAFSYQLILASDYEADEHGELLMSLGGSLYGTPPEDFVARLVGDGNGGTAMTTGWQRFEVDLGVLPPGSHTLRVGAYNNKKTWDNEVTEGRIDDLVVTGTTEGLVNAPPEVDAGPDQSILESDLAVLDGEIHDDFLPFPPGSVLATWELVSGPGEVTLADPHALQTLASFSAPGSYLLRLLGDDGEWVTSDEIAVEVIELGAGIGSLQQVGSFDTGWDAAGNPLPVPAIDPASAVYHPPTNSLFIADSEINEVPEVFAQVGANIFRTNLAGDTLLGSWDVTQSPAGFTNNKEPTGITWCASDGHFYMTNDDREMLFRYAFDGAGFTLLDQASTLPHTVDPEGISCDGNTGQLYVVGGDGKLVVYHYAGGFVVDADYDLSQTAGNPQGVPSDAEGVAFDAVSGRLLIVSEPDLAIFEFTTSGVFVEKHSLAGFAPTPLGLQGGSVGPSSANPGELSVYVVDGGVDNNQDPSERDGRIYEALILRE